LFEEGVGFILTAVDVDDLVGFAEISELFDEFENFLVRCWCGVPGLKC
jgi:hypothetical protein